MPLLSLDYSWQLAVGKINIAIINICSEHTIISNKGNNCKDGHKLHAEFIKFFKIIMKKVNKITEI